MLTHNGIMQRGAISVKTMKFDSDFEILFKTMPSNLLLLETDSEKPTLLHANNNFIELFKLKNNEIAGQYINDILGSKLADQIEKSIKRVIRTGKQSYIETEYITPKTKEIKQLKVISKPISFTDDKLSLVLQEYEILKNNNLVSSGKTKENLLQALTIGRVGTFIWNVKEDKIYIDKIMAELYGFDSHAVEMALPLDAFMKIIHPDDFDKVSEKISDVIMNVGERYEAEHRIIDKGGKVRWVFVRWGTRPDETTGNKLLTGAVIDIDDKKKTDAVLIEKFRRAAEISDSLPIILFTATPDGTVNYFNKMWSVYTGITLNEDINKKWYKAIYPKDVDKVKSMWSDAIKNKKAFEFELRIRRKDGRFRWHLSRVKPICDTNGNVIVWFGSYSDADDWHKASDRQERLEQITKVLREQRKELVNLNQTKDEFISVASHQLRTPATAVKQYLGMMLEGYLGKLTQEQKSALQTAYDSNERQLETVNDLLRVAQADAGKVVLNKESCDLISLIKEVIKEQKNKYIKKNQKLLFNHTEKQLYADVDKARLRMVLENLIDNANKYTYEGKKVVVGCDESNGITRITIKDEGVGIDPKSVPKLFHKFSRIDNPLSTQAGGTGLGLYWAFKIVELHDGKLEVKSNTGEGTIFTIQLPQSSKLTK